MIPENAVLMLFARSSSFLQFGAMMLCIAVLPAACADEPKAGTLDASGHLVLQVFRTEDRQAVPMVLKDEYGYVIYNDGPEGKPAMRVVIALKDGNRMIECRTWPELEKALGLIPMGSKIHRYDKCLCPLSYGLKDSFWGTFEKALKKRKLVNPEDEARIICTCG